MENAIQTTHELDFEVAPWHGIPDQLFEAFGIETDDPYPDIDWVLFRVGTCEGQWRETPEAYEILSVINSNKGNGHLDDVIEWFVFACKKSGKPLIIREFFNDAFRKHLIEKRNFEPYGKDVILKPE